jgi:hypothetical protein
MMQLDDGDVLFLSRSGQTLQHGFKVDFFSLRHSEADQVRNPIIDLQKLKSRLLPS